MKKRPHYQRIVSYFLGCEAKSAKLVGGAELSFQQLFDLHGLITRLHTSPVALRAALKEFDHSDIDKYADITNIVFVQCEKKAGIMLAFSPFELWDNDRILGVWPVSSDLFSQGELAKTYDWSVYDPGLYFFDPTDPELTARVNQYKGWFSRLFD